MKLLATIVLLLFLVACGDFDLETEPETAQSQPTFHPDPNDAAEASDRPERSWAMRGVRTSLRRVLSYNRSSSRLGPTPFTGTTVTEATKLDIDHMVPLANAHHTGGHAWTPERKRAYANDLTSDAHLIAVTSSANRSKGARGPDQWRPPDEGYWCQYATDWVSIKTTWGLTATPAESEALSEMLKTCKE